MNIEDTFNQLIISEISRGNHIGFQADCHAICQYHNKIHTTECWYSHDSVFYAKTNDIPGFIKLLEFRNAWFPNSKIQTFKINRK